MGLTLLIRMNILFSSTTENFYIQFVQLVKSEHWSKLPRQSLLKVEFLWKFNFSFAE